MPLSDRRLPGADLRELLRPALSTASSAQIVAEDLVPGLLRGIEAPLVVDLGCGRGDSVDVFRTAAPGVRRVGLEPGDSDQARPTRTDVDFRLCDGVELPLADGEVDLVFCK